MPLESLVINRSLYLPAPLFLPFSFLYEPLLQDFLPLPFTMARLPLLRSLPDHLTPLPLSLYQQVNQCGFSSVCWVGVCVSLWAPKGEKKGSGSRGGKMPIVSLVTWIFWIRRGSFFVGGGGFLCVKCIIFEYDRGTLFKRPPRWGLMVFYF